MNVNVLLTIQAKIEIEIGTLGMSSRATAIYIQLNSGW